MSAAVRVITITAEELREIIREELDRARPAAVAPAPVGYLTVAQAAERAAVCEDTIRAWISSGRLAFKRAGKNYRITPDALDRALSHDPRTVQEASDEERIATIVRRARR